MKKLLCGIWLLISTTVLAETTTPPNWYDNFIFKDTSFNFQFIRTLGYTYTQGADLGEAITAAKSIPDGDIHTWYNSWLALADRSYAFAEKMQQEGNTVSAREAYFRASNYYRTAGFYMDDPIDRPKSLSTFAKSKESFIKGIASLPYIKTIQIPYENTTLPGYFLKSEKNQAPLLIVMTGFDGTAEELYFEVGAAAHARGYNVLLFDGPGQGEVLRKQNLPFRPDWEKVISPVIDYGLTLPDINKDKIALMGISMGGFLAPRAAAFDNRIKVLIANTGIYDYAGSYYNNMPFAMLELLKYDPNEFNKIMTEEMQKRTELWWLFQNGMWVFNATSPADMMNKIKPYTLQNVVKNIKANTLVVDSEADLSLKGQAKKLYDELQSPKTYLLFTKEQAAQAHCQMGAIAISNEVIFSWLDKALNWRE